MKCTAPLPRRPGQHRGNRLLEPFVGIRDDEPHTLQPAFDQAPQKRRPKRTVFGRTDIDPEHLPVAVGADADRHHRRLAGHPAVNADFVIRRVDPQIAMLAGERARAKRRHDRVELGADARHFRFRDPINAERLHQVIDLPRRDAVHIRFLDDRRECVLRAPARLQQRREIGPGRHLRNRQLDRADARVPGAGPRAIAVGRAITAAFVTLRADEAGHFGLHQRLRQDTNPFAQHVAVLLLE